MKQQKDIKLKLGIAVIIIGILAVSFLLIYNWGTVNGYDEGLQEGIIIVAKYQSNSGNVLLQFQVQNETFYKPVPIDEFCQSKLQNISNK